MIKKSLEISLTALMYNPLRSFLTTSGIVIGIAAVVTVLSIGKGHEEKIKEQIQKIGANFFWVDIVQKPVFGSLHFRRQINLSSTPNRSFLTYSDAESINNKCSAVKWSAPVITSFAYGSINGKDYQFNIIGTTPEYLKVKSLELLEGRYLAYEDLNQLSNVCVIEENSSLHLPLGQNNFITLNSKVFNVVGEVKSKGYLPEMPNSVTIYIPITTAQIKLIGSNRINTIYCISRKNLLESAKKEVLLLLDSRSRGDVNFFIRSSKDLFNTSEKLTRTATMVTAGVGMISLFVGGIGIMNILLASVFERIKEIGIRRSVGANKRDILLQFLFESMEVSLFGGVIGVITGILVTQLLNKAVKIPTVFSYEAVLVGIIFSSLIGIIFGIYPAWKAANLDPIESLRYE